MKKQAREALHGPGEGGKTMLELTVNVSTGCGDLVGRGPRGKAWAQADLVRIPAPPAYQLQEGGQRFDLWEP